MKLVHVYFQLLVKLTPCITLVASYAIQFESIPFKDIYQYFICPQRLKNIDQILTFNDVSACVLRCFPLWALERRLFTTMSAKAADLHV